MQKQEFLVGGIPSILWGNASDKLFIAVHGNMSNKADTVIEIFAEEAASRGYQVLSFDLPEHGERKAEPYACSVQNCFHDLGIIMNYAKTISEDISLFACSMGAYFSLLTFRDEALVNALIVAAHQHQMVVVPAQALGLLLIVGSALGGQINHPAAAVLRG